MLVATLLAFNIFILLEGRILGQKNKIYFTYFCNPHQKQRIIRNIQILLRLYDSYLGYFA